MRSEAATGTSERVVSVLSCELRSEAPYRVSDDGVRLLTSASAVLRELAPEPARRHAPSRGSAA